MKLVDEQSLAFAFTIVVIITKFILAAYLGQRVWRKAKEQQGFHYTFMFSLFLLLIGIGISRSLYFYFDFYLTLFNPDLFYVSPNIWYWKVATFFSGIFMSQVIFVLERDVLKYKLKLIPTLLLVAVAFTQLLLPVNDAKSFALVSNIGSIGTVGGAVAPLTFIYLAHKTSGKMRRVSIILTIGIIIYAFIGTLMSEPVLLFFDQTFGMRTIIIVFVPIAKVACLAMLTYGAVEFEI